MIKLVVAGSKGRMGQEIIQMALRDAKRFSSVIGFDKEDAPTVIAQADVVVDFSVPSATAAHVQQAKKAQKAMVIGTTGLDKLQQQAVEEAARNIPIVQSPNMSLGMNVLFLLVQLASRGMQPRDILISEIHHIHKKDAPSGSALGLARRIEQVITDRPGSKLHPPVSERGGEEVGEHVVKLYGWHERLILLHDAETREPFAAGALHAAAWVAKKKPGLYSMYDVLELDEVLKFVSALWAKS